MLSLDGTLVVQLVNFVVFLAILNVIFFKPVGAAIARRRAYVEGLKHDIETLQTDAKGFRSQAEERRAAARRDADEVLARGRADAGKEAEAIVAAAQTRAGEIVAKAHTEVAAEIQSAQRDEARIVDALADQMLARVLGGAK